MDAKALPLLVDALELGVDADVDAVPAHGRGKAVAEIAVEIAQDLLAAMDHGDLDAKPGEDRSELHADIAGTDDHDAFRQAFELEAFIRGDEVLRAGDLGDHRMAAGGDQDGLGPHRGVPASDPHRMLIFKRGVGEDEIDARLLQRTRVSGVQPVDLAMDVADQSRPVEPQGLIAPAEGRRIGKRRRRSGCHRPSSFFGTQPRITQVPPTRYSSAMPTLAPSSAASRPARTPPEPAPITNKS